MSGTTQPACPEARPLLDRTFFLPLLPKDMLTKMTLSSSAPLQCLMEVLLSILVFSSVAHAQNCYYPDGSVAAGMASCSTAGGACCPYQWDCLSNGLCYLESADYLGRYTCTDRTWASSLCPDICTHSQSSQSSPDWWYSSV